MRKGEGRGDHAADGRGRPSRPDATALPESGENDRQRLNPKLALGGEGTECVTNCERQR